MAKSKVLGVTVGMQEGHGVEVVFYRYDRSPEQRAMGFTDWMQSHRGLTRASCRRVERIVRGGNVIIWPDRLAVAVETDDEFWAAVRQYVAEAEAVGEV